MASSMDFSKIAGNTAGAGISKNKELIIGERIAVNKPTFHYAIHPVPEREFPALNSLIIGVDIDRELRREKITRRLKQRLEEGMVDEVRRLIEQGISPDDLIYYGLEYKYLTLYVIGKLSYEEMFNGLEIAIHQFAKRQMTWFRGMERRGFNIHWVNATLPMEEKIAFVKEKLKEI